MYVKMKMCNMALVKKLNLALMLLATPQFEIIIFQIQLYIGICKKI